MRFDWATISSLGKNGACSNATGRHRARAGRATPRFAPGTTAKAAIGCATRDLTAKENPEVYTQFLEGKLTKYKQINNIHVQ